MIPLYPKTDRERKARNLAAITSFEKGSIPFMRELGIDINIDATRNIDAVSADVTNAVARASKDVRDCTVLTVEVSFDIDGKATYNCEVK